MNYFKFKEFIANGRITKKFKLVLPNIEIRVLPVTGSSTPINLHCIFNPIIDFEIENRFLGKLKFANSNSSYSAMKSELVRFGRDYSNNPTLDQEVAYKKGVEQYVINLDSLELLFKNDLTLRENTIIVVSNNSRDGVSGIIKHEDFFINENATQLDATRQSIYQFSDAIFSANERDRNYFLGKSVDNEKTVLRKCGSLKPCFHGCDAHSNEKIFKPDGNRFCWIKADPTFEGLKQTLYEPEDRVKIQALKPDVKKERYVISKLEFLDSENLFGYQEILLNENLNAIIGGKSSGKSLLLFVTAKSIDPEQVNRTSERLNFGGYNFNPTFDFKVTWKNEDQDLYSNSISTQKLNKITYIPQLYINHLVEKNNKYELNTLIKSILLQDFNFKEFYDKTIASISILNSEIERLLNEYLKVRTKTLEVREKSKDTGNSDNIQRSITKIEEEISKAQKSSNLSETEFIAYNKLLTQKSENDSILRTVSSKELILNKVLHELNASRFNLLGQPESSNKIHLKGHVDRILDELGDEIELAKKIKDLIESNFDSLIMNLEKEIASLGIVKQKSDITEKIKSNTILLTPFLKKIEGQKELQKLTDQLESEKIKFKNAQALEIQYHSLFREYNNIRAQTGLILRDRLALYKSIEKLINDTKNDIGSGINLKCSLIYNLNDFVLYDQVNKAGISFDSYFNKLYMNGLVNYDLIPSFYENWLRVTDDKLYYNEKESIPLKLRVSLEDVLRGLIKDCFEFDCTVTYKGDNLLAMSPGKKGTVLLILFLQISSSEFPIFIDQPEDNLDNRTIYDLLCKMIKEKKKNRQIILVSHNANLVVTTDTENIIVANQQGQDTENETGRFRFEYVNGSLEHSFLNPLETESILLSQGIREHVCDILEGGGEAFKQRERKYSIKL